MKTVQTATQPLPYTPSERELGVLIGFDGSEQGMLALYYGARAAQRRDLPLTVTHAYTVPAVGGYSAAVPELNYDSVTREGAEDVLNEAKRLLADYPGEVSYRLEQGDAAGVLVDLSAAAELAVVGGRGRGGFLGRVLGSVASALPAHAQCPTVIVPRQYELGEAQGAEKFLPSKDDSRPVVVGVDGSSRSRVAAVHAAEAAASRGAALRVVMALPPLDGTLIWYPELAPRDDAITSRRISELQEKVEAEAHWVRTHYPDLEVEASVELGTPDEILIRATGEAQLTAVGTRGRGGLASALLGSVSQALLMGAVGPVMVVPRLSEPRLDNQPHFTD